ncbi:MAG: phosphomannomutase/phosphoglucomutase [Chloroflexota bacterium]|nr:phosphomannomutase/phosphoglucomutase [Dehalococcoidia bacterium]MDW8254094.1 phosphomannomutase/phosphoglucomutase [Chloroflexota bacterium]
MTQPAINPTIFRDYDIRGVVGTDLDERIVAQLGRAFGTFLRRSSERPRVAVGHDARLTSPSYAAAAIDGLLAAGCDVVAIGMVPTPVLYFAVNTLGVEGGLCVTASHNPPRFNGLKLRKRPGQSGEPLTSEEIQEIRRLAETEHFADGAGTLENGDAVTPYLDYLAQRLRLSRPVRVVLDTGNGATGPTALEALRRIGAEVCGLFTEPDGTFPNHLPNPLKPENLQSLIKEVQHTGAEIGVALDGDGDRLGIVADNGAILWPDQYLIFLARHALAARRGPVVFDVKCSMALIEEIERAGGTPIMTRTGYTNIARKRREVGAVIAGEFSGHLFFDDPVIDFDDGTFAAGMLLHWLAAQEQPLSAQMRSLTQYAATPEERYACNEAAKQRVVEEVRRRFKQEYDTIDIDGVRIIFPDGWALVRASNTEPALTARYEARSPERLRAIVALVKDVLRQFPEVDLERE